MWTNHVGALQGYRQSLCHGHGRPRGISASYSGFHLSVPLFSPKHVAGSLATALMGSALRSPACSAFGCTGPGKLLVSRYRYRQPRIWHSRSQRRYCTGTFRDARSRYGYRSVSLWVPLGFAGGTDFWLWRDPPCKILGGQTTVYIRCKFGEAPLSGVALFQAKCASLHRDDEASINQHSKRTSRCGFSYAKFGGRFPNRVGQAAIV